MQHEHDRATFLTALGGAGATALLPRIATAQTHPAPARRIDVHRHASPPFYQDRIKGLYSKPFPPPLAGWTPDTCLADGRNSTGARRSSSRTPPMPRAA